MNDQRHREEREEQRKELDVLEDHRAVVAME
jgi:hypothetical protein